MNTTHRLGAAALVVLLPLTACTSSEEKEPTVDPKHSLEEMKKTFVEVMAAAAPDARDVLSDATDVPCGGIGGNEWNKIKYTLQTVDGVIVEDRAAALAAARAKAAELGLEISDDVDALNLSNEHVSARITVRETGVHMTGETPCGDNPDR